MHVVQGWLQRLLAILMLEMAANGRELAGAFPNLAAAATAQQSACPTLAVQGLYYRPLAPALHHGVVTAAGVPQPQPILHPPAPAEASAGMQPGQPLQAPLPQPGQTPQAPPLQPGQTSQAPLPQPVPARQQARWFVPIGYQLPEECVKHEELYRGIFEDLRQARGVPRGACRRAPCAVPCQPSHLAGSMRCGQWEPGASKCLTATSAACIHGAGPGWHMGSPGRTWMPATCPSPPTPHTSSGQPCVVAWSTANTALQP